MTKLIFRTIFSLMLAACVSIAAAADAPNLLWGSPGGESLGGLVPGLAGAPSAAPSATAKLASGADTIHGSGSPAGYMLSHGNVVASSLIVTLDGRRLVPNKDYFVDTVSGGISFGEPIGSDETIRATYQYDTAPTAGRSLAGLPLIPLMFGGTGSANFLNAYHAADPAIGLPFDVMTLGMNMNFNFGRAGLQSMYYMSDPRQGSTAASLMETNSTVAAPAPVSDRMIVQKANFNLGKTRVMLGYQDIGSNFTGFATLREQAALPPDVVNQLQNEKGVRRLSAGLEFQPSHLLPAASPWNSINWMRIYDSTGAMQTIQLQYRTPTVGIVGSMRSVGPAFSRLSSLSKDELTSLALATKQQFDPNATAGQVTDADRLAVTREAGLSHSDLNTYLKLGPSLSATLAMTTIRDNTGDVAKQTLSFASKSWQGWVSRQTISSSFQRLSLLAPSEVASFGNEYGMAQTTAGMSAKLASKYSLTGDYSLVQGGPGNLLKTGIGLSGRYFLLKANYQSIDNGFTRIMDVADPQKASMVGDVGFKKFDLTFGGQLSKALKLDTSFSRANNPAELLGRSADIVNLLYSPSSSTKLIFQHNLSLNNSNNRILSGTLQDLNSFEHRFKNNWFFSTSHSANLTEAAGGVLGGTTTDVQHFETNKALPAWVSFDQNRLNYMNGTFQNTSGYNMQMRMSKSLTLLGSQSSVDRGTAPSESVSDVGFKWVAARMLNAGLHMYTQTTNYAGNGTGYLATLGGRVASRMGPLRNLNLTGEYGASTVGQAAGATTLAQAIGASTPYTQAVGNVVPGQAVGTFTRGLKLDGTWGKNVVGVEYSHMQLVNGQTPWGRGFQFRSDPDAKKWYHVDLYMKDTDIGLGTLVPLRNINADCRLSPTTQLAYTVNQYKELPNGLVDLTVSRSTKLTTRLRSNINLVYDFRRDQNLLARTNVMKNSIGIQRQVAKGFTMDFYYGLDEAFTPTGGVSGKSVRLKMDKQVSADRYFTFTGEATVWDNSNPAIPGIVTAEAQLDFRMPIAL